MNRAMRRLATLRNRPPAAQAKIAAELASLRQQLRDAELLIPVMRADIERQRANGDHVSDLVAELEEYIEQYRLMRTRYLTLLPENPLAYIPKRSDEL